MYFAARSNMMISITNWAKRIGWLLLIWSASVVALGVAAFGLRLLMGLLGMSR